MQTDVIVGEDAITGTLKYLSEGQLVDEHGAGNFIALKFEIPEDATSCKVGLEPSEGTGLVEIIDDPDKNGAFKITDKSTQKFKIVTSNATASVSKLYDLSDLTVTPAPEEVG